MTKILITPTVFGQTDKAPMQLLHEKGFELVLNDTGSSYSKAAMQRLVHDVDGIILGTDPCDRDVIAAAPRLKVISRFGVGADNVDAEYCKERGVAFYRTVGVNADAVADSTFALILAVSKKIVPTDNDLKAGNWNEPETFEINHKTIGLIGFGNVGAKVAKRARGFDMRVIAYDPYWNDELARTVEAKRADSIDEILREADIVSLHLPLSPATYHIIDAGQISRMKPRSILVNTARGGIIDEQALAAALEQNKILGAGLDVFENEPLERESKLLSLNNVVLSPHIAADTFETIQKVSMAAAHNLIRGLGLE